MRSINAIERHIPPATRKLWGVLLYYLAVLYATCRPSIGSFFATNLAVVKRYVESTLGTLFVCRNLHSLQAAKAI